MVKEIPSLSGYWVDDQGAVYGPVKRLKLVESGGYLQFSVNRGGRIRVVRVHHAVAEAFLGPRTGRWVCHKNDNKKDNRPANLYFGDVSSNTKDAIRNGRFLSAERHPMAKLTWAKVRALRSEYSSNQSLIEPLARKYGISLAQADRICKNQSWNDSTYTDLFPGFPCGDRHPARRYREGVMK